MALPNVLSYVALEMEKSTLTLTKGEEETACVSKASGTSSVAMATGFCSSLAITRLEVVVASSSLAMPLKDRRVSTTVELRGEERKERRKRR